MKIIKKPPWLNKKVNFSKCGQLKRLFNDLSLNTVCQQARCPNIGECFSAKVATFLILGKICSRNCRFCAVKKGIPENPDLTEPQRLVQAVKELNLRHVVITSVTRDDLPDGGASVFTDVILRLRNLSKMIKIEVLVPDFKANPDAIGKIIYAKPDVFAHNIETIPRLYSKARNGADYNRSLRVLDIVKKHDKRLYTKSGLMLGLGESEDEVFSVCEDLRRVNCDFLSIGQYLAPSKKHMPVEEYIFPEKFEYYKEKAKKFGFLHIESDSYVRSSYLASEYFNMG